MAVFNRHVRQLSADPGVLLDSLASSKDRLWPDEYWPPIRFDRALGPGADGGHGPVRYHVLEYLPGRWVRFQFTAPRGFDGFHEFSVHDTELHHVLAIRARGLARLTWPLLWRPLHDALIEDGFDRAERELGGTVTRTARWSRYVRLLRWLIAKFGP